eukprot:gnl/TRDRNA2_/TRDRNA2_84290_c0_seq1.p1 gnl/TRDRNA2_/TRDRNA2_84290_c0~~gnl/TRDRNA2_/TRDRNA2_84290_c0_seq1.p1  ORF type:complete len:1140 (+),score=166.66 gnl/TRDRNA2_/TRDRNA2_84290_c0_seq1:93-3512(+)
MVERKHIVDSAAVICAFVLIVVAITGPLFAFVIVSCVTTRPCKIGNLLSLIGAECEEGSSISNTMMHGETCTVLCSFGLVPTSPVLTCDDGVASGADGLRCGPPPTEFPTMPPMDETNARVIEDHRTACLQAMTIQCDAPPGGAAWMMRLEGLSAKQCEFFLAECRALNPAFEFVQHSCNNCTTSDLGACTFGCYTPSILVSRTTTTPAPPPPPSIAPPAGPPEPECDMRGPPCIHIVNSCNAGDNGDYFRSSTCIDDNPQWVQPDKSHRMRYVARRADQQGGTWIIEEGADPKFSFYGTESARQPTHELLPRFGRYGWNAACREYINSFTYQISYRSVNIRLEGCTCNDVQDCNDHGRAVGDKDNGPNCFCECDPGWSGEKCDIPLCNVPDVLFALVPACEEGKFIPANGKCTTQCEEGYAPTEKELTCDEYGIFFIPRRFKCEKIETVQANEAALFYVDTTTELPACHEKDCSFRGQPRGDRHPRTGKCICICDENFQGEDCRVTIGECRAPKQQLIPHAQVAVCDEGMIVKTSCTGLCEPGYYAMPAVLECTGTRLEPPQFSCFGGPSVQDQWCELMRQIALGSAGASGILLFICCLAKICVLGSLEREKKTIDLVDQVVEHEEDDLGRFHTVKFTGKEAGMLPLRMQAAGTLCLPPPIIEVRVMHVYSEKVVMVNVLCDGTMGDIKETLAAKCRQPEMMKQGKLVRKVHTGYADYPDTDLIGNHRYLLWLGMDFPDDETILEALADDTTDVDQAAITNGLPNALQDESGNALSLATTGSAWQEATQPADGSPQSTTGGKKGFRRPKVTRALEAPPEEEDNSLKELCNGWEPSGIMMCDPYLTQGQIVYPNWHEQYQAREERIETARLEAQNVMTEKEREQYEAAAKLARDIKEMEPERLAAENALREAMATANVPALRKEIPRAYKAINAVPGCPSGVTSALSRVVQLAEARLNQYDDRVESIQCRDNYIERVRTGLAADWHMTQAEFDKHIEEGNVGHVRAGLKARLSVMLRSQDGLRRSVLHRACAPLGRAFKAGDEEAVENYILTVEALVQGRANANAADQHGNTPLDLAVSEGLDPSAPAFERLHAIGLKCGPEAADEARAQAAAEKLAQENKPVHAPTPKKKATTLRGFG